MEPIDLKSLPAAEVLSFIRKEEKLQCPKCQAVLEPIPAKWTPEMPLHGATCPNDQKHFLIYTEPVSASRNVRDLIKELAKKSEGQ